MTQNKLLNEFLDITRKPLNDKGFFYDMDIAYKCVKIADEFAIEFGKWILRNFNDYGPNDEKELLEIYKKEKGL
jgi:hypothetical protein